MISDIVLAIAVPGMFCWLAWVIFSTIRRYKIAKLQSEVQSKLLDKVSSGQELLAYAQTEPGRQLLASLQVEGQRSSPHGRIINALCTGIILFIFGAGLLFVRHLVVFADEGLAVLGTLSCFLGVGFALSAAASYYLSKSFGLMNGARS
jgi:hypothetical protein